MLPVKNADSLNSMLRDSQLVPLLHDLGLFFPYIYSREGDVYVPLDDLEPMIELFRTLRKTLPGERLRILRLGMGRALEVNIRDLANLGLSLRNISKSQLGCSEP